MYTRKHAHPIRNRAVVGSIPTAGVPEPQNGSIWRVGENQLPNLTRLAMQKKMEEVSVSTTTDGMIEIQQPTGIPGEEDYPVRIHPGQVDVLVAWLQEAKRELENERETLPPMIGRAQ